MRRPRADFAIPHSGGSGHRTGRHDDRSARCSLDWDRPDASSARVPGSAARSRAENFGFPREPRWSAARRAPCVNGRDAERRGPKVAPRGAPLPRIAREGPLCGEEREIRAHPAPAKEYGRCCTCGFLSPSPGRGGSPRAKRAAGWGEVECPRKITMRFRIWFHPTPARIALSHDARRPSPSRGG
jgi:hypothetical protein